MARKFSKDQSAIIVGCYEAAVNEGADYEARKVIMQNAADLYKVSINVIRAKLVGEGVYVKKEVAAKAANGKGKAELVSAFEAILGVKLSSLSNMTKKDLEVMWDRFIAMSEARNASEGKKS